MIAYLVFAVIFGLLLHGIHRKVIARIQNRPGPPIWQEILHMLKFAFKQTWIPETACSTLYVAVVLLSVAIWSYALIVLDEGGSILIVFGVYLLHKIVEHGLGLSAGSPYTKFGAIRSVLSAASELPLIITLGVLYLFTGSLMISDITAWEAVHGPLLFTAAFPVAIAFYVIILSKMSYSPFGIVESKELVSGYKTEHFGAWRAVLDVGNALKTYVLLYAFILIFIGQVPFLLTLVLMLVILVSLSFVCAYTPMLGPYDNVTIQSIITGFMVVYIVIIGVLML